MRRTPAALVLVNVSAHRVEMGPGGPGLREQRQGRRRSPGRPIGIGDAVIAARGADMLAEQLPGLTIEDADMKVRPLDLDALSDPAGRRRVVGGLDLVSALVTDELRRRQDRLLERRHAQARFRDLDRSLDTFDFALNKKMNRALVYELATARFIAQREDVPAFGAARHGQESPRANDRSRCHPPGLPCGVSRRAYAAGGAGGDGAHRHAQKLPGRARRGAAAHHRRPRHAQAPAHRRGTSPGADHAAL